jgi:hypothetical protein
MRNDAPLISEAAARAQQLENLAAYRQSDREQARTNNLLGLIPTNGIVALDIGARDGYLSRLLADRFESVVALDLSRPSIDHPNVASVQGDVCHLAFADGTFDLVVCSEVLEHIPSPRLEQACAEIVRVAKGAVVIGVPYKQDIRFGRTTCRQCGGLSPPWSHVNSFDEQRLRALFEALTLSKVGYVGTTRDVTNAVSVALLDFAGNPYGTYDQVEGCIHCGSPLLRPGRRNIPQRIATRIAFILNRLQRSGTPPHGNWIHVRFDKWPAPRKLAEQQIQP